MRSEVLRFYCDEDGVHDPLAVPICLRFFGSAPEVVEQTNAFESEALEPLRILSLGVRWGQLHDIFHHASTGPNCAEPVS